MNKKELLGMDAGTASNRLVKDLLFSFVVQNGHVCFRCGKELTRDTFSIEHKDAWMVADDPIAAFFDLENIAYSHLSCNSRAKRNTRQSVHGTNSKYISGCRCVECKAAHAEHNRSIYTPEYRRNRYLENEKPH